MSQADELLNSLTSDEVAAYTADSETEPHIVIGSDRFITIPDELKRIAVQHDHNIETVTFDCPRYWDGNDLSNMVIYINYMRPDGKLGQYKATGVITGSSDPSILHFNWTISKNVTLINGNITFLVCAKTTDFQGREVLHWNSERNTDLYVSEGMELGDTIVESEPDVITQLLVHMGEVDEMVQSADVLAAYKYYTAAKEIAEEAQADHEKLQKDIEVERARVDKIIAGPEIGIVESECVNTITFGGAGTVVQMGVSGSGVNSGLQEIKILSVDDNYVESPDDQQIIFTKDSSGVSATIAELMADPTLLGEFDGSQYLIVSYYRDVNDNTPITISFVVGNSGADVEEGSMDFEVTQGTAECSYEIVTEITRNFDAEVSDIRVDVDGNKHPNAGESVRSQIRAVRSAIDQVADRLKNSAFVPAGPYNVDINNIVFTMGSSNDVIGARTMNGTKWSDGSTDRVLTAGTFATNFVDGQVIIKVDDTNSSIDNHYVFIHGLPKQLMRISPLLEDEGNDLCTVYNGTTQYGNTLGRFSDLNKTMFVSTGTLTIDLSRCPMDTYIIFKLEVVGTDEASGGVSSEQFANLEARVTELENAMTEILNGLKEI